VAGGPDPGLRWIRRISVVLAIVGAVTFLLGAWAVLEGLPFPTPFLCQQLRSGIGVAFMAYAVYIRRRSGTAGAGGTPPGPEVRRLWTAGLALVVGTGQLADAPAQAPASPVARVTELVVSADMHSIANGLR
jgi:heme A synthase